MSHDQNEIKGFPQCSKINEQELKVYQRTSQERVEDNYCGSNVIYIIRTIIATSTKNSGSFILKLLSLNDIMRVSMQICPQVHISSY